MKIGDTFTADGNSWIVVEIVEDFEPNDEGIYLAWDKYLINICPLDKAVFVYRKFKNGNTRGIDWVFSFDEIKMVNDILKSVKW